MGSLAEGQGLEHLEVGQRGMASDEGPHQAQGLGSPGAYEDPLTGSDLRDRLLGGHDHLLVPVLPIGVVVGDAHVGGAHLTPGSPRRCQLDSRVGHDRFLPWSPYHEGVDVELRDLREVGDKLADALQRFGYDGDVDFRLTAEAFEQLVGPGAHQHAHGFGRGDGREMK